MLPLRPSSSLSVGCCQFYSACVLFIIRCWNHFYSIVFVIFPLLFFHQLVFCLWPFFTSLSAFILCTWSCQYFLRSSTNTGSSVKQSLCILVLCVLIAVPCSAFCLLVFYQLNDFKTFISLFFKLFFNLITISLCTVSTGFIVICSYFILNVLMVVTPFFSFFFNYNLA